MNHRRARFKAILFLFIGAILCSGFLNTSRAEEESSSGDDNLSFYNDNPDFKVVDGLAIEIATNTLVMCRSDARSVIVPGNVKAIGFSAFMESSMLQSVIVSEGVKEIGVGAFQGHENLTSITLPTTLEVIYNYAFVGCNLDTLIIPRNTFLDPNLGQSEWYGVLDACRVKTLVFYGTDGLFLPTTFGDIKFPADGSGRIVFWGNPPEYIDVSGLQFNYNGGEVESGTFSICYPAQFAEAWAPNGETEWNGILIRALSWSEEQKLIQKSPKLFSDEDRTDVTEYPGWSFDQYHNVTIYSEEGWYRYCIANWGMEINDLRFAESVDFILEYFNVDSDEGMYPGPSEIVMKRLLLPSSLTQADLDHMIFEEMIMAEGNRHVAVDNGRLIDPDSGDIVWEPTKAAEEQTAAAEKLKKTPDYDQLAREKEQPLEKPRQDDSSFWSRVVVAVAFTTVVIIAALLVSMRDVWMKKRAD